MTNPKDEDILEGELVKSDQSTAEITGLVKYAIDKNVDVESLERLVALRERVQLREDKSLFAQALSDFQKTCPALIKTATAKIKTRSGIQFEYKYPPLDSIAKQIAPYLTPCGLSYYFDSEVEGNYMTAICTVEHVNSQTRTARFTCPTTSSAGMSDQQKFTSALTTAKRQALIAALGLTSADIDDDGVDTDTITDAQVADLAAMIDETNADLKRFLKYMDVEKLADIRAVNFRQAVTALENKRKQGA